MPNSVSLHSWACCSCETCWQTPMSPETTLLSLWDIHTVWREVWGSRKPQATSWSELLPCVIHCKGIDSGKENLPWGCLGRNAPTCQYRYCTVSIYTSQIEPLSNRERWKLLLPLPYLCSHNLQFDSLHALTQVQSIKLILGVKNTKIKINI